MARLMRSRHDPTEDGSRHFVILPIVRFVI